MTQPETLQGPVRRAPATEEQWRGRAILALAVVSGATDAIGFLALGSAFTSVMTGNMVLFGLGVGAADWALVTTTVTATLSYIAGCMLGARIAHNPQDGDPVWPRRVTWALVAEAVLFLAYAVGYLVANLGHPGVRVQHVLLACTAAGLGVQSAAIQRFGVSGLSTTYMTGTLTTVFTKLVTGSPVRAVAMSARLLLGLIVGAAMGGLLVLHSRAFAPLLQLALLAYVLVLAATVLRSDHAR